MRGRVRLALRPLLPLALLLLVVLVTPPSSGAAALRLPRGYTMRHYCSACRAVARELRQAYLSAPASATLDSGSFRLAESGKQPHRTTVPLRTSELHAVEVLDAACAKLDTKYVVYAGIAPDVFVPGVDKDRFGLSANASGADQAAVVRALPNLCAAIVDEFEDRIKSVLRAGDLEDGSDAAGDWAARADGLCAADGGIVAACADGHDPGSADAVVELAKAQKLDHDAFLKLEADVKLAREQAEADADPSREASADDDNMSETDDTDSQDTSNRVAADVDAEDGETYAEEDDEL
jgi:hypothetical protein